MCWRERLRRRRNGHEPPPVATGCATTPPQTSDTRELRQYQGRAKMQQEIGRLAERCRRRGRFGASTRPRIACGRRRHLWIWLKPKTQAASRAMERISASATRRVTPEQLGSTNISHALRRTLSKTRARSFAPASGTRPATVLKGPRVRWRAGLRIMDGIGTHAAAEPA